ncbi:hypothetical protein BJ973_004928 [Actinoplanes tereljensis]|uniref:Uncharacterized protein n=1 Tax=Paractinoplanes tereljensis TaxID=571912 RepID=A0A919NQ68_9ACTN|nr:hypothetical protein [Actinoplanes tereljensis]GIF21627.1 hypothetical protein Ate02nite_43570 [Actinoplanes tereljensis]
MSTLRQIWVDPGMGFPDRPWGEHPDEDAFARSANAVFELYTEAVRPAKIQTRHSELRIVAWHDGDRDDVLVTVHPELVEGFEMGVVSLPPGIAGLTPQSRAELVLEVLHAAASRLGQDRGWDQSALDAARAHALAAGLHFRRTGPARTSPDRRHVAEPTYAIYPDGYGRVVVHVRRRSDNAVVAVSPLAAVGGFTRAFDCELRWRSRTVVEFQPGSGLAISPTGTTVQGNDRPDPVRVDLGDPATFGDPTGLPAVAYDADAGTTIPGIRVLTYAEKGSRLTVLGGWHAPGLPEQYVAVRDDLLAQLAGPEWQTWWAASGVRELEISYRSDTTTAGISARLVHDELRATIRRPPETFPRDRDPAAVARADVESLLLTVRRRTDLGEHPPLH